MSAEPRREAEQIVGEHEARVIEATRTPGAADWSDSQFRLVDVLAAAIEHVRANDDVPDDHSVGAWDMDADTFRALRAALSALREDG